ncbi:Lrp/AsnC family transcriptional regulator [Parapedomonas caeni]|jgi:DNA-binding Lrp family transcriptional regulator
MNEHHNLDAIDRQILRVLQRHGDISHAALAEQVGASAASCWRRIRALENAGVLGPTVRLLNPQAVGRDLDVICQVRMRAHDMQARANFERFIDSHREIMECYSMSGEWDYLLRIVVSDVRDYERFLMRELLSHPAVATCASHFALSRVKFTTELPV